MRFVSNVLWVALSLAWLGCTESGTPVSLDSQPGDVGAAVDSQPGDVGAAVDSRPGDSAAAEQGPGPDGSAGPDSAAADAAPPDQAVALDSATGDEGPLADGPPADLAPDQGPAPDTAPTADSSLNTDFDLQVTQVAFSPATLALNAPITRDVTVKNVGSGPYVGSVTVQYLLSTDKQSWLAGGGWTKPLSLGAGASSSISITSSLPSAVPVGSYYVQVQVTPQVGTDPNPGDNTAVSTGTFVYGP